MNALLKGGVIAAVAAMSLAACGGGGSSGSSSPPGTLPAPVGPTATAVPTPTPTPTPVLITVADYSVQPIFECVYHPSGSVFNLRFGYNNLNSTAVQINKGSTDPVNTAVLLNTLSSISAETGATVEYDAQPDVFQSGLHKGVFELSVGGETSVTWYLAGNAVSGSTAGTACTGPLPTPSPSASP